MYTDEPMDKTQREQGSFVDMRAKLIMNKLQNLSSFKLALGIMLSIKAKKNLTLTGELNS